MICHICQFKISSIRKLSKHIRDIHSEYTIQSYYDTFKKRNDNDGCCGECNSPTRFISLGRGYLDTCGKRCAAIAQRKKLRQNPEKFKMFANKVSINMNRKWGYRNQIGENIIIAAKISSSQKIRASNMTDAERIEKFGWLNKLDPLSRAQKIEQILDVSLRPWYANATEDQIEKLYTKKYNTCVEKGYITPIECLEVFSHYSYAVRLETEKTYRKYKNEINPNNLPRGRNKYHLDHIVSIFDGFKHNISVIAIASKNNLQMLHESINCIKHSSSWGEIHELLKDLDAEI